MNPSRALHHIRHKRPHWYQEYHKWEHHGTLHWITFVASCLIILIGFATVIAQMSVNTPIVKAHADTKSTVLTQAVTGGSLTISNDGNHTLGAATVDVTDQNTTGTLGTITVTDNRGSGVGWNTTATSTNFVKVNAAVKTSGSNTTVTTNTGSTYSANTAGIYTITIANGGSAGVATYDVTGLETASGITTGTGVAVGTHGVLADFGVATYVTGDSWTIRVDVIPVTGLQVTPGSLTTIAGSSTNVSAGSVHTFSSTADATALITASAGYGLGSYSVAPSVQLTVPANSYANTYTATVTETVL